MQASSAISFRLPPVSISAAASTGSPLPSTFVSGFSGLSIPHLPVLPFHFLTPAVFAFFRPLQFWVLTTQPLFLPFPLLPGSASHCVIRCSVPLSIPCLFPSFRLISHPFFRLSVLGMLFVSFCSSLLRSHSRSTGAHFCFRFRVFPFSLLSFVRFRSGSSYSAFRFFLSCSSLFCLTVTFQVLASPLGSSFSSASTA